jgi:hypothetical protein
MTQGDDCRTITRFRRYIAMMRVNWNNLIFTALVAGLLCWMAADSAEAKRTKSVRDRFMCDVMRVGCAKSVTRKSKSKKTVSKKQAKPPTPQAKPSDAVSEKDVKPRAKPEPKASAGALPKPQPKPKSAEPLKSAKSPGEKKSAKHADEKNPPPEPKPKPIKKAEPIPPAEPVEETAPPKAQPIPPQEVAPADRPPLDDGTACRAELARLGVKSSIPTDFQKGPNCPVANPVQLTSVTTKIGVVGLPAGPILNCEFAKQFVTWLADVGAPTVAAQETATLAALSTGPGYQCRGRNGDSTAKLSEHATGNAIDIDAVILAGKKRVEIAAVADPSSPHYRMLMALRVSACGYFTTVLGPGSNAAHATHYHFDLGRHGKSSNYRICE